MKVKLKLGKEKMQTLNSRTADEIMRELATYTSITQNPEHPIGYLKWFLKTCYGLFDEDDQLLYFNVQYFVDESHPQVESAIEWTEWIPTLFEYRNVSPAELRWLLMNMMVFLGMLRESFSAKGPGDEFTTKAFTEKFIFEIVRGQAGRKVSNPVSYNPDAKILTITNPDLYERSISQSFIDLTKVKLFPFVDEKNEYYWMLHGERFIRTIDKRRKAYGKELKKRLRNFMHGKKIQALLRQYHNLLARQLEEAGIVFTETYCKQFLTVNFIHAWLKSTPYNYLIPLVSAGTAARPATRIQLLVGSKRRLPGKHRLHAVPGSALAYLREWDSTSALNASPSLHSEGKVVLLGIHPTDGRSGVNIHAAHDGKYKLDQRLIKMRELLRKSKFNISQVLRSAEKEIFPLTRKTVVRYCKELCIVTLANNGWDIVLAVKELAGNYLLESNAAQKIADYFLGDKKAQGIFHSLEQRKEMRSIRKKFKAALAEFVELCHQREISREKWVEVLRKHYRVSCINF
jgi:hypothetical protein